jgi:hypothetical protein
LRLCIEGNEFRMKYMCREDKLFILIFYSCTACCFNSPCTGKARVRLKIPHDGNRTNQYCTDTWPWCMGVFGARFAVFVRRVRMLPSPCHATRNLSFFRFHRHRHVTLLFQLVVHWEGVHVCMYGLGKLQACVATCIPAVICTLKYQQYI